MAVPERIFEGAELKFRACCSPDTAHALREAVEWVWATAQREAVTATTPTTHQRTLEALREALEQARNGLNAAFPLVDTDIWPQRKKAVEIGIAAATAALARIKEATP